MVRVWREAYGVHSSLAGKGLNARSVDAISYSPIAPYDRRPFRTPF